MIEPAAYGVAVCFGPHTHNFRDIVSTLKSANAAKVIENEKELTEFVRRCVTDPLYRQTIGNRARTLVASSRGATDQTVTYLLDAVGRSRSLLLNSAAA